MLILVDTTAIYTAAPFVPYYFELLFHTCLFVCPFDPNSFSSFGLLLGSRSRFYLAYNKNVRVLSRMGGEGESAKGMHDDIFYMMSTPPAPPLGVRFQPIDGDATQSIGICFCVVSLIYMELS